MLDERVFLAASYLDVAEAEADFEALRQLYVDLGEAAGFDAVTIGRKASGEVRFHREPDRPPGSDADEHVAAQSGCWSCGRCSPRSPPTSQPGGCGNGRF